MLVAIADTHAAIWYLFGDSRLGREASEFIDQAVLAGDHIGISAITLAEMVYLVEKQRIPETALQDLFAALANPEHVLQEVAVESEIVRKMGSVARLDVPDLPDRILAATALYYEVPLISRDSRIQASEVKTIW
jgi:PIN domain nuclease of toxin-antitoxin system